MCVEMEGKIHRYEEVESETKVRVVRLLFMVVLFMTVMFMVVVFMTVLFMVVLFMIVLLMIVVRRRTMSWTTGCSSRCVVERRITVRLCALDGLLP